MKEKSSNEQQRTSFMSGALGELLNGGKGGDSLMMEWKTAQVTEKLLVPADNQ